MNSEMKLKKAERTFVIFFIITILYVAFAVSDGLRADVCDKIEEWTGVSIHVFIEYVSVFVLAWLGILFKLFTVARKEHQILISARDEKQEQNINILLKDNRIVKQILRYNLTGSNHLSLKEQKEQKDLLVAELDKSIEENVIQESKVAFKDAPIAQQIIHIKKKVEELKLLRNKKISKNQSTKVVQKDLKNFEKILKKLEVIQIKEGIKKHKKGKKRK